MNTRSLKFRLVVWYAGWLTLLFVVFGLFVYASLNHYLTKSLHEALSRRARQVASMVQRSEPNWERLRHEIPINFAPEANNRFTRVTAGGVIQYVSGLPADRSFDPQTVPPAPARRHEAFERRSSPDETELFVFVLTRDVKGHTFVIEEGEAAAPIDATLHAWLVVLLSGLVVLILGAVLGGFLLVNRALAPVDRIIRSAERISSQNLSERLPVAQTRDELERLSVALNHMIRRLDESFQYTQRFLADASHELRTPLTIIQAELEAVVDNAVEQPESRELAGSALEEVERLRKIVEGLFALGRLDAGEAMERSARVDLGELAESTAEQMWLLAEDKRISIQCRASPHTIVQGDRARLKQVIVNLLDNAVKYTPDHGRIDVTVAPRDSKAVLEVADNGLGIPQEALPHVFERFYRADKARSRELGGAGLGLSIVQAICLAHDGRVEVQSRAGEGTRFIVELPLAPAPAI